MKNIEEKINREAYEHFINGTKPPKLNKAVKKGKLFFKIILNF